MAYDKYETCENCGEIVQMDYEDIDKHNARVICPECGHEYFIDDGKEV